MERFYDEFYNFAKSIVFTKFSYGKSIILLSLITTIGAFFRFLNLNQAEFWYDEAYTGILIQKSWPELINALYFDVHPPFYIFMLKFFTQLTGVNDQSLRIVSVICGILLIPLSYYFFKILFGNKNDWWLSRVGPLITSFILAINPFFIIYSQEARSYMFVVFLYLLLLISFLKARAANAYKLNFWWIAFAALTLLIFLTHYISALGILAIVIFDYIHLKATVFEHIKRKSFLYTFIYFLPAAILAVYVKKVLLVQYSNAPEQWWIPFVSLNKISDLLYAFIFGVQAKMLGVPAYLNNIFAKDFQSMSFIILVLISLSGGFIYSKLNKSQKEKFHYLFFAGVLPIIAAIALQKLGFRLIVERYLIQYSLAIIILISFILTKTKKWLIIPLLLLYFLNTYQVFVSHPIIPHDEKSAEIKKLAQLSESYKNYEPILIFDDPIDYTVAKYYFLLNKNPTQIKIDSIGNGTKYQDWEIITNGDLLTDYTSLKGRQRIFIYSNADNKRDIWYRSHYTVGRFDVFSTIKSDLSEAK